MLLAIQTSLEKHRWMHAAIVSGVIEKFTQSSTHTNMRLIKFSYPRDKMVSKDVEWMKILNVIFAITVCTIFLLIAYGADGPDTIQEPNPMKQNQEQFTRMKLTNYTESVK